MIVCKDSRLMMKMTLLRILRERILFSREEKEPEVKKVVKTKVKHKRSHSLPKRTKTKVKYKEKSHPVMTFIKTIVLLVLLVIILVALAFGVRFYLDNPETVKQWFWQGYRYLFT